MTEVAAEKNQVMLGMLIQLAWVLSVMFLPIAVQEMVFAVNLIVRGFDSIALTDPTPTPAHAA